MGDAHADISKHVKAYIGVFLALAVLTVVTVAISTVHFSGSGNIVVALIIAAFKASLVAAIFMHLKWEKSLSIWLSLGICAAFFVFLILIPVLAVGELPPQAQHGMWDVVPQVGAAH